MAHMAGAVEQGFDNDPEKAGDEESLFTPIAIETEHFQAEAISMFDLNGEKVLEAVSSPGANQLPYFVALLKQALTDEKAEYLAVLSFRQLAEATLQWVNKSQNEHAENDMEDFLD